MRINDEKGLTLIELCLTILIMGLLMAVASPKLNNVYFRLKFRAEVSKVTGYLENIPHWAKMSGTTWRFRIGDDSRHYYIEQLNFCINPGTSLDRKCEWRLVNASAMSKGVTFTTRTALQWTPRGPLSSGRLGIRSEKGQLYEIDY